MALDPSGPGAADRPRDTYLKLVRGQTRGPASSGLRFGLSGLAVGYRAGVAARNLAYDRGWLASARAAVPVVAVGNLTLGGTGKTPMVEWVARWFRRRGVRVAVLSRGYGPGQAGATDEALVLEENLPDVPQLQDPDRVALAGVAVEELGSELLILDDGFQHRRLARDLDVVLVDATDPFGLGRLFPRGLLREPVGSLRRAGLVVLTRADLVDAETRVAIRRDAERRAGPLVWAEARHAPVDLVGTGVAAGPLADLEGRRVAAFCGVGNPEGFRRTLEPLCGPVDRFRSYPDHHAYSAADVADLSGWVGAAGVDLVLTTQKDLVKLRAERLGGTPLRALRVGMELLAGAALVDEALAALGPRPRDG